MAGGGTGSKDLQLEKKNQIMIPPKQNLLWKKKFPQFRANLKTFSLPLLASSWQWIEVTSSSQVKLLATEGAEAASSAQEFRGEI